MLVVRAAFILAALGLWVYAIYDVIRTPGERLGSAVKLLWLTGALFVPVLGSLAWILFGRPDREGSLFAPREVQSTAPDDSPEFLARLEEDIRIRRRAEQLRRSGQLDPDLRRSLDEEIRRLEEELRRHGEEESE